MTDQPRRPTPPPPIIIRKGLSGWVFAILVIAIIVAGIHLGMQL